MSKGFDTFKNVADKATQIKADGYGWVARYYFKASGFKVLLGKPEAVTISAAGLYIVSVYENGFPTSNAYFTEDQGKIDSENAVRCAQAAGQPQGSAIYFAYDADLDPNAVMDYAKAVHAIVKAAGYITGCYGSGAVCKALSEAGYVSKTWLSQSHGFRGYAQWQNNADIVQGPEGHYLGLDIDADTSGGNAGGWKIAA
jgi:Domain of unknown function (DUF1906)